MSKKIYCVAMFKPKAGKENELFKVLQALEPNAAREDGCIQYTVTRKIDNPFAPADGYPIAFHEIWADQTSFEAHCERQEIQDFFQTHCVAETGLVEDALVRAYSDEPADFDAPILA
ncbi:MULTISPECIES: putative quinol monooxygenase [unclassified Agarivorans]|uniref:putative quinol monooxygenase n=1 Tax=unclassified Agarivorans TaxID=2636026 RepID=UPI003D7D3479